MHTTLIVQSHDTPPSCLLVITPAQQSLLAGDRRGVHHAVEFPRSATSDICLISLVSHMKSGLPHIHPDLASLLYFMFCPRVMQSATSAIAVSASEPSYVPSKPICEINMSNEVRRWYVSCRSQVLHYSTIMIRTCSIAVRICIPLIPLSGAESGPRGLPGGNTQPQIDSIVAKSYVPNPPHSMVILWAQRLLNGTCVPSAKAIGYREMRCGGSYETCTSPYILSLAESAVSPDRAIRGTSLPIG